MKKFIHLLKREFKIFLANDTLRSVFILGPIVYGLLIGLTYKEGKVDNLPVIVIDQDHTPTSSTVVDMLGDNKTIKVLHYAQEPLRLEDEVIKTKAAAVVKIPENFEKDILLRKYPEINVYVNTGNVLTANFSSKAIQVTLGTLSAGMEMKTLQKRGANAEQAKMQYEPFKANYITMFNTTSNYLIFMWPAMMGVVFQQVVLLAMAVSFASDFRRKSFLENYKGSPAILMLIMKCLPIWIISVVNVLILSVMGWYFKIPVLENIFGFAILATVFIMTCTFLGALFSVLLPNALKATQFLMIIASPAFIIGGFTWPSSAMPTAIQYLANIIPLTPFLEAFKIILIQKGSFELTYPYLQHLLILMAVYFVMCVLALKLKVRKLSPVEKEEEEENF